jgi:hypothetical protein
LASSIEVWNSVSNAVAPAVSPPEKNKCGKQGQNADERRYLFGKRLSNPRAEKIFDALRHAPGGLTRREINDLVFKRNAKAEVIEEALALLKKAGWVRTQTEKTDGRDAERFFPARP